MFWPLYVLNVPVFLFIGWLVFDTKENAAVTLYETVVEILKAIFVPRIVRVLMGDEDEGAWVLLPIAAFLFARGAIVYAAPSNSRLVPCGFILCARRAKCL